MAPPNENFSRALIRLWFRLTTILSIGLLVALALLLYPPVLGWLFYISIPEALYEIACRGVFLCAIAMAASLLLTVLASPFLRAPASRTSAFQNIAGCVSGAVVFFDLFVAVGVVADSEKLSHSAELRIFLLYIAVFLLSLFNRNWRKRLAAQFDGIKPKTTRIAIGAIAAAIAILAIIDYSAPTSAQSASVAVHPKRNILFVTFDALSAEDMSLYGYDRPTTPMLEQFAKSGSVFTHFYSGSTFTTPSLATIFTGLEPSEDGVYHLQGRLRAPHDEQSFVRALHDAGYTTGATISSPMAYFFTSWRPREFDWLDGPVYRTKDFLKVWNATSWLHPQQSFGSRLDEFNDFEKAFRLVLVNGYDADPFKHTVSRFPPAQVFAHAREEIDRLPEGYFLWVHVFAPHHPYLPAEHMGKFLPGPEMRTGQSQMAMPQGEYPMQMQDLVTQARARYDEFIADADTAFGQFVNKADADGKLANTVVIVSADHGESFQAGVYQHDTPFQTVPEIHIPLVVRMPGQTTGSRIDFAADQTSLAPTILELAGVSRAPWMHGRSLVPWLGDQREASSAPDALAFCQYLATSSVFRPVSSGSVGVTDGVNQYVVNVKTGQASLRDMRQPLTWKVDRSAQNPEKAKALRAALEARFPGLLKK
jgi:arylsulfatase A-like enzyme